MKNNKGILVKVISGIHAGKIGFARKGSGYNKVVFYPLEGLPCQICLRTSQVSTF